MSEPLVVAPMKAVTAGLPTDEEAWAFELKWDGYRTIAHVAGGRARLQSLKVADVTARYPELDGLADALNAERAILDGEIVALDGDGHPDFGLLQRHRSPVAYVVFDVLHLNGIDTTSLPYESRRALLAETLETGPRWSVPSHTVGAGAALLHATAELGLEGIMAKRLGSTYQAGRRSPAWRKIKHRRRQELVIGGFTGGEGVRSSSFGALLVGYFAAGGLQFAGAVGTGFDAETLLDLRGRLDGSRQLGSPFVDALAGPGAHGSVAWGRVLRSATWVRPELVCEVAFAEWTADGLLRHPSFVGLRDDKDASSVVREPG